MKNNALHNNGTVFYRTYSMLDSSFDSDSVWIQRLQNLFDKKICWIGVLCPVEDVLVHLACIQYATWFYMNKK